MLEVTKRNRSGNRTDAVRVSAAWLAVFLFVVAVEVVGFISAAVTAGLAALISVRVAWAWTSVIFDEPR